MGIPEEMLSMFIRHYFPEVAMTSPALTVVVK
jgi:hypothetical protein